MQKRKNDMALDGILLNRIVPQIAEHLPLRIQKIWNISATELLFQVHGTYGKQQLLISTHSVYNRLLLSDRSYPTPAEPGNFVMVLRKYLEGGVIESLQQADLDRWCTLTITRHNNLGDRETLHLYVELMGKYANVILVGPDGRIIDALKRIPPFENARRTIHPGAQFVPVPPQDKKNPFTCEIVDPEVSLTRQFGGFSPFLSKEVEYRMAHGQSFSSIMQEIASSDQLYVYESDGEPQFHCIPLTHLGRCRQYGIFEGFDVLYYHREEKERIRQMNGDVFRFVRKELKHQESKLPRLMKELDMAMSCDQYRVYGDLLYTYGIQDTKGMTSMVLKSYEDDSDITVPLDPKLDGPRNAAKHYQKYGKLKKGQMYMQEQIDICSREITYFTGILEQLEQADFDTTTEIVDELVRLGYIEEKRRKNNRKSRKKNTKATPHVTTVTLPNGVSISYGRNNLQNDEITWHLAKKNEIWMHAKDYHGSHVVIHTEHPDEDTIRIAAMTAAWFSKGRMSSSVPVNWCPVKNLKKIPGAKPGMVQLGSYRTIYIDPDEDTLVSNGIPIL